MISSPTAVASALNLSAPTPKMGPIDTQHAHQGNKTSRASSPDGSVDANPAHTDPEANSSSTSHSAFREPAKTCVICEDQQTEHQEFVEVPVATTTAPIVSTASSSLRPMMSHYSHQDAAKRLFLLRLPGDSCDRNFKSLLKRRLRNSVR